MTGTVHEQNRVKYGVLVKRLNKSICFEGYILKTLTASFLKFHAHILSLACILEINIVDIGISVKE